MLSYNSSNSGARKPNRTSISRPRGVAPDQPHEEVGVKKVGGHRHHRPAAVGGGEQDVRARGGDAEVLVTEPAIPALQVR